MKFVKLSTLVILFVLVKSSLFAQNYNADYTNPIHLDLLLSGNYGELRPNHFHSGIDIKTNGRINQELFSIEEGYVSRINVSPWGYGKAIYITHPNGFTSVYAHCNKFNTEIETYIKSLQYSVKTYAIDTLLPKDFIKVKKGEFIAFSGNSGNSFGPHLHFEIRTSDTEHPINPLLFGFKVKDNKAPIIYNLVLYDINNKKSRINSVKNSRLATDTFTVSSVTGFGIEVYDYLDLTPNKCAPYKLSMYKNNKLVFSFVADEFDFEQKRYVNSHIDYARYLKTKKKVHKLYVEPNDKFSLYRNVINKGLIYLEKNETANIKIIAEDFNENKTTLNFVVKSNSNIKTKKQVQSKYFMRYREENSFVNDSIKITIPKNALYNNLEFRYKYTGYGKYKISDELIPLHKKIKVEIKPVGIDKSLINKTIVVRISRKGRAQALLSEYDGKYISTMSDKFGVFRLQTDTIKPRIKPINIYPDAKFIKDNKIKFKITDNLSGIMSYNGYIDGKWVLFEYDAKKASIYYYFDEQVPALQKYYNLKLIVKDAVGNAAEYKVRFFH